MECGGGLGPIHIWMKNSTRHPLDRVAAPALSTERTVDETLTAKMRNRAGPRHRPQSIDSVIASEAIPRKAIIGTFP